uniref:universal stress protein YxiE-like n=1 Tax=Styela clava TaxID=7725 RepID=UPI00193AAA0B|nr:universal stress protein YxiE-like [Styela clava]
MNEPTLEEAEENAFQVLLCVDGSKNAYQAFNYYVSCIHKPRNKVFLVHVTNMVYPLDYTYTGAIYDPPGGINPSPAVASQFMENEKKKSEEIKAKYNAKCEKHGISHEFVLLSENNNGIGAPIVAEAKKRGVDMILLGNRGQGLVRRTILGSVSDYVLHHSHVPTLICPRNA